jgi:hypothetical protein
VTRRALILGGPRLWLLAWRVSRKRALPTVASSLLAWLDGIAARSQRGIR